MNTNDIETAIDFLYALNYKYLVLQCFKAQDIPYIKRALIKMLGEPSRIIDNSFYYGTKRILMMPISKDTYGLNEEQCFYVAHKDNEDWKELRAHAFAIDEAYSIVPYMLTNAVTIGDVYNMLVSDGMTGNQALDMLSNEQLIKA